MTEVNAPFYLLVAMLLGGCVSTPETVVFVTKTTLGVDVEQTPPSASIAYDRAEGYFGPRYETSAVPPVLAVFSTNGQLFGRDVKQIFATGNAARLLANPSASVSSEGELKGAKQAMFFGTSTTVGVKIGYEPGGATTTFSVGYKRKELSVIPVTEGAFPSLLASLQSDIDAGAQMRADFGVGQLFASGSAASDLARRAEVREVFMQKADSALSAYRSEENKQGRIALVTLSCLAAVSDAQLPKVWSNAEALGVFDKGVNVAGWSALPAASARDSYTRHMALLNADSRDATPRMNLHRQYVCGLAGR